MNVDGEYSVESFKSVTEFTDTFVHVYVFLFTIFLSALECEHHENRFHEKSYLHIASTYNSACI